MSVSLPGGALSLVSQRTFPLGRLSASSPLKVVKIYKKALKRRSGRAMIVGREGEDEVEMQKVFYMGETPALTE